MSLKNQILKLLRSVINPIGYDVVKYRDNNPSFLILEHLNKNNIKTVLDVGANTGQYGCELRKAGYKGRIISFEPLSQAYQKLCLNAINDKSWKTFNYALGDTIGTSSIHVSKNSPSSSLLPMTSLHSEAAPGSEYVQEEKIEVKTLDHIYESLGIADENVFLKIDTQGYEQKVLEGSVSSLQLISGIQVELSTVELYEGEGKYYSICSFIEERGFRMVRVIPGFTHKGTREMLQFDAVFFREKK